jgi:hypothetical protein
MAKPLPQDYVPSNPPTKFESWHRWIVDELTRISIRFQDNPVLVTLRQFDQTVQISPVLTAIRLGVGAIPDVDSPGGDYDPVTGIWTCPLNGIYLVTASVEIDPFGTGNKAYQAEIVFFKNGIETYRSTDSAVDDVPLSVNLNSPALFTAGDEIHLDLVTIHSQFTGPTLYDYTFSAVRLGAAL